MHTQFEDLKKRKRNDNVLRDGDVYRVPLFMMDGVSRAVAEGLGLVDAEINLDNHRPHFAPVDAVQRAAMYDTADSKLSNRWREPAPLAAKAAQSQPTGDAQADSYARYDAAIQRRYLAGKA